MKIEKVECIPMIYHMKRPIYSGTGRCDERQLLLVRIYTDTGLVGLGEAEIGRASCRERVSVPV